MTSPFKHFRKHQKAMLAVIGILTMLAFTILPSVMDRMGSMSAQDPAVATAFGETVRQSDLSQMLQDRNLANQFVHGCLVMATGSEQMAAFHAYIRLQRNAQQYFGTTSEEEVMRIYLLAEEAKRVGVVVSDDTVNKFLREITEDKVPSSGYASLVKQLKVSQAEVFSALRTELAAAHLAEMSMPSAQATPAQRWDYYRRLKQRTSLEVAPVRVAEFLDEVADPSQAELAAFFDAHKEQEPDPLSPTPGFKVPKQAAFQYFKADYDKFYDEASVTQEEIEKHYEQYKDQRYLYSAFDSAETEPPATDKKPEADESGETKEKSETPAESESKPSKAKEPEGAPAKEKAESATEKPAEEKPAADKPAEKKADEEKPSEEKAADEKPADQESKSDAQSSLLRTAPELTAAAALRGAPGVLGGLLLADADAETTDEKKADEKKTDEKPAEAVAEDSETEKKPAADSEKPADEAGAKEQEPAAKEQAAAAKPAAPLPPAISDDLLLPRDIRQGVTPKYAPLWRVEASIRKELAGQKAVEKMTKALEPIQAKMRRFSRDLGPVDDEEDEGQPQKKQALPDFSKLAQANQLTEQTTGLLTALTFKEQHPALADATPEAQSMSERPRHFLEIAYGVLPELQSAVVKDLAGNRYLAWKTEEKEAYVPELSEVRDEVVKSWKMAKARDLARKRAEALVDEARKADKSLKDAFADQEGLSVTTTPAFSWLTRGAAGSLDSQAPVRLSEVEGVQDAGPDFMREAFNLSVGETGFAMNQPQTICYVIRVVSLEPSREVLRTTFMADSYSSYAAASMEDRREVLNAWIKGIENEAHLTWKRPPDERRR